MKFVKFVEVIWKLFKFSLEGFSLVFGLVKF